MERLDDIPKELISSAPSLDYKTPISEAISYLRKYPALIISKNKEYYGVVDSRTLYRSIRSMKLSNNEKIEKFSVKVAKITNSTSIYDVIYHFYKSGSKVLPFSAGKKIAGVLERKTLMKMLLSLNALEGMKVNEAMTTPVLAIDSKASIAQAKSVMNDRKVNRLVVLQNSKFIGLITNYDIVRNYTKGAERLPEFKTEVYSPSNVPIDSIMVNNVHSIEYNRNLSDAVRDMVENKVSSLVVMKSSSPIGILTVTDILESVLARQKVEASKIFMSGFDENTYQYEDDARSTLESFVAGIEKLSGIDVDYITLKIKSTRGKLYEMQARLSLGRHGIISMHTTEYMFGNALSDLLKKLKHRVIKEKESILSHKKINTLREQSNED